MNVGNSTSLSSEEASAAPAEPKRGIRGPALVLGELLSRAHRVPPAWAEKGPTWQQGTAVTDEAAFPVRAGQTTQVRGGLDCPTAKGGTSPREVAQGVPELQVREDEKARSV